MSATVFEPHDLAIMQSVFDQTYRAQKTINPEHRTAIAMRHSRCLCARRAQPEETAQRGDGGRAVTDDPDLDALSAIERHRDRIEQLSEILVSDHTPEGALALQKACEHVEVRISLRFSYIAEQVGHVKSVSLDFFKPDRPFSEQEAALQTALSRLNRSIAFEQRERAKRAGSQ